MRPNSFIFKKEFYTFPTNDVVYIIFWPWRPVKHFKTLLIKAAQPENLFSLEVFFLYMSNLCQPQKVSNKVTFFMEQRCSKLQQRKNQLAQKSDVVSFKATSLFSYTPTMLTNALPGAQWIRDMGT